MLVFGAGFSGLALARAARAAGRKVTLVSREPVACGDGIPRIRFAEAGPAISGASHIVATAPPGEAGDPVLFAHATAIASAAGLRWIGYISTTGVYGDRDGALVYENTPPAPSNERSHRRLDAERSWSALADHRAVDIFRTAGIYGPGRSAFDALRDGTARRIDRPGHLFSRIHVDDIAGAVLAAAAQTLPPGIRVLHLADDHPAASADVTAEAARLLGLPPPPLVPYEIAVTTMSPMARSFWSESRRMASAATQAALGYRWRHPDYRSGLAAILAEERADRPHQQRQVPLA